MKVQINIPDERVDDAERLAILSGQTADAIELFSRLRAVEEPIDITETFSSAFNNRNEMAQFFIGLVCCAGETINNNEQ